tara:strand:+ start:3230 stop:4453 length:1224 start_codon:yes stop_codon:yes gene_type:complete
MAAGNYTQSEFYEMVDGMSHQKFSQVNDRQVTSNRAVRYVLGDIDIRSTKRKSALSPNLFKDVYDYSAPSDLKENKIIDIRKQVRRSNIEGWMMVDESDFDRTKEISSYRIAVSDDELVRILKIDGVEGSVSANLHNCDSLTANGTWAASADASNLTIDTENFITSSGALNFDTAKGAATAVVTLTDATQVDLTDHDEKSSLFVWVFIPDATDAQGESVTNFILRWGNDSSNYWHRTVTTNNEGAAFYDGWNLLRFDWNGATEVGTVAPSTIDYIVLTITKDTALEADTDWRVDDIVSRVGEIYDVIYYSKFGWQNSSNAYIEESTATTDTLNADTTEIELFAFKAAEMAAQELKELKDVEYFRGEYERLKGQYTASVPSEALRIKRNYYEAPQIGRGGGWKRMSSN